MVAITPSWRESQHVRHVVKHIIAPYGEAIDARPPVPSLAERAAERASKREAKDARRALNRRVEETTRAAEKVLTDARRALARAGVGRSATT